MAKRPHLIVNPRDDETFVELVEHLAAGARTPADLQTALRGSYPAAVVRDRGLSAESIAVWYVYRDGHWVGAAG